MEITDFLGGAGACMLVCVCMCVCVSGRVCAVSKCSGESIRRWVIQPHRLREVDEPVQVGFDGVVPFHMQVQSLLSVRCLLLAVRDLLVEGSRDTRARRR